MINFKGCTIITDKDSVVKALGDVQNCVFVEVDDAVAYGLRVIRDREGTLFTHDKATSSTGGIKRTSARG